MLQEHGTQPEGVFHGPDDVLTAVLRKPRRDGARGHRIQVHRDRWICRDGVLPVCGENLATIRHTLRIPQVIAAARPSLRLSSMRCTRQLPTTLPHVR